MNTFESLDRLNQLFFIISDYKDDEDYRKNFTQVDEQEVMNEVRQCVEELGIPDQDYLHTDDLQEIIDNDVVDKLCQIIEPKFGYNFMV